MLVMADWGTATVTLEEFMVNPDKYVKLSSSGGRTQVFVQDPQGETILILGTGPITPPTQAELDAWEKMEQELAESADDTPGTSWFD